MTKDAQTPNWQEKLRRRWKLNSLRQVWLVLLTFACTGFTILFIRKPILDLLGVERPDSFWPYLLYLLGILPVYQAILLFYGFIFGQFRFFWEFEKQMFRRMLGKKKK